MKREELNELNLKKARDKWYKLAMIFSSTDEPMKARDVAKELGVANANNLRDYFDRWGDRMVERYGKLPCCILNTRKYDKYMEMK